MKIESRKRSMYSWFASEKTKLYILVVLSFLLILQCTLVHVTDNTYLEHRTSKNQDAQRNNTNRMMDQSEPIESENFSNVLENQTRIVRALFQNQLQADQFGLFFVLSGQSKVLQYATFLIVICSSQMISMKYIGVRQRKDGKK